MNFSHILEDLLASKDLSRTQMTEVMSAILSGQLSAAQQSAFLVAMRAKGESVEELLSAVHVVRKFCVPIEPMDYDLVDTCGTGGDGSNTFNISTIAALVAAACGVKIAKHGNRAVSSSCGSADFLEAAGAKLELAPQQVRQCIDEIGFGFLFAPQFHQAMREIAPARKELGIKTLFNLLGPLSNLCGVRAQLMGVYAAHWLKPIAQLAEQLELDRAMIVHSEDGMDEISLFAPTQVMEYTGSAVLSYAIQPQDFFTVTHECDSILVRNTEESYTMGESVLNGEAGPAQDIVLLNAAAVIYVSGQVQDLAAGIEQARQALHSGQAREILQNFVRFSQGSVQEDS